MYVSVSVALVHRAIAFDRGPTRIIIIIRGIRKTEWREHDIMHTRKYDISVVTLFFYKNTIYKNIEAKKSEKLRMS